MQFQQPHGHHGEISHHVVLTQERPDGLEHVRGLSVAAVHDFIERKLGAVVGGPMPAILECLYLGLGLPARRRPEKDVVGRVRVKRRIQVNKINRLVRNALPEHVEIVTVEKGLHATGVLASARLNCRPRAAAESRVSSATETETYPQDALPSPRRCDSDVDLTSYLGWSSEATTREMRRSRP